MYALYLVPFVLTFVVVGLINCFKQFPCKPICYEYFEDEEEQDKKVFILFFNIYFIYLNYLFYISFVFI